MDGVNLQCPVDDALNLVHDVVLRKQVLEIPEKSHVLNCFPLNPAFTSRYLFAGSPGNAMVARQ